MCTAAAPLVQLASDSTFDVVAALGRDWVFEPKLDGHRLLVSRRGCWTRSGRGVRFGQLEAACPEGALLDCELVTATGRSTASRVLSAVRCGRTCDLRAVAFDVLEVGGASVRHLPQLARRALLVGLSLAGALSTVASYADATEAMEASAEGIVAKRTSASYVHARTDDWRKAKWSYRYTAPHVDTRANCRGRRHGTMGDALHDEIDWSAVEAGIASVTRSLRRQYH